MKNLLFIIAVAQGAVVNNNIFIMQLPGEFSPFIEKNGFLLSGRGVTPPPTPLVVRPLKKTLFFMCVFP